MRLLKNRKGVTMVEYGLIASLVSIAAIAALTAIGPKVKAAFDKVNAALP